MPEERGEKGNHNNSKDKTPRVESRGGVVAGGQPGGIAHAKLLGRRPANQTSPDIDKDFLNLVLQLRMLADTGWRFSQKPGARLVVAGRSRRHWLTPFPSLDRRNCI
jgi:hypothetical protein